ncbi:MAG: hypothetical protein RIR73_1801 [Chloroflexota bacterium]|jgi:hypothetical protein
MNVIENRDGYIYATYNGQYKYEKLLELAKEAARYCTQGKRTKVLANLLNMTGKVESFDRFKLGVQGALIFRNTIAQVAAVYHQTEIDRFAENTAVNRGMNTRIFSNIEDALAWLGIEEDSNTSLQS